jgi:hypothetical protein
MKRITLIVAVAVALSALTLAVRIKLFKTQTVHAQSVGFPMITSVTNGVFLVSNNGAINFCTGESVLSGAGFNTTIALTGKCNTVSTIALSPQYTWTASPVPGDVEVWYLGSNGQVIGCVGETLIVNGQYGTTASCANYGTI